MTLYRGPGGTGSATSDADTTLYQDFLNQTIAARDAALQAEINAELAETNAETAETNAETAETNAETAATNAASSASAAASSASSASTSASNASTSASAASTSATNAASSASSASSSASAASTSASNAATSETNASNSASSASTSATNAANSASTATTQATNAASSATAAASSASSASTSATNAANSASAASTSATNAANSATSAAASATAAAASAASIDPTTLVRTTGTQTIGGDKTFSSNPTLSAGTTNGVLFLNAGKAITSGTAFSFDGSSVTVKTSSGGYLNLDSTATGTSNTIASLLNNSAAYAPLNYNATAHVYQISSSEGMRLTSTGLGIGNSNPTAKLDVTGTAAISGAVTLSAGTANGVAYLNGSKVLTTGSALTFDGTNLGVGGAATMYWSGANRGLAIAGTTNGAEIDLKISGGTSTSVLLQDVGSNLRLGNSGNFPIIFHISDTEQMRLTSTGLGIGTSSPSGIGKALNVYGAAGDVSTVIAEGDAGNKFLALYSGSASNDNGAIYSNQSIRFGYATSKAAAGYTNLMTLDSSGNLGLGVTPSAWNSVLKAIAVGRAGSNIYGQTSSNLTGVTANAIFDSSNWKYVTTDNASRYQQNGGVHSWYTAPSGTAGNAISFTQAMTLNASGNLGVGTTSPSTILTLKRDSAGIGQGDYPLLSLDNGNINGFSQLRFADDGDEVASILSNSTDKYLVFRAGGSTERARITSSGDFRITWNQGSFAGFYFDSTYYQGFTNGANTRELFIDNRSNDTRADIVFRTGANAAVTERMRIDFNGNVGIGTSSPSAPVDIQANSGGTGIRIRGRASANSGALRFFANDNTTQRARFESNDTSFEINSVANLPITISTNDTERARIDSSGNLLVGKTTTNNSIVGSQFFATGNVDLTRSGGYVLSVNRLSSDGDVVLIQQDTTTEGSISVSGTTVSYNGGHLSRWAQTTTAKDESLVKGTVLSNLDEMNVYTDAEGNPVENEQLNKVKVSDVEGDANVAGVFVNWTHDDAHNVDEINMAMTGDMIIRIAQGVTVQRGDLLMSAGNGTAKPQGDDIVRSKTIAKVTSTHVTCTYADGSFCVPCVLMAC